MLILCFSLLIEEYLQSQLTVINHTGNIIN